MAIVPSTEFPGQIDTSDPTGYPLGKARNKTSPADATGTPITADLVNDIWGFNQQLLSAAGITASGDPEKVGASQLMDALKVLFSGAAAVYTVSGSGVTSGNKFTVSPLQTFGGTWGNLSTDINVPRAGRYEIALDTTVTATDATNPNGSTILIKKASTTVGWGTGTRWSATTANPYKVSGRCIVEITDAATQTISLTSGDDTMSTVNYSSDNVFAHTLVIRRIPYVI